MLYFLICADEETGRQECRERGWVQAAVNRFYTPERDDVRVVRRYVDVGLLPGGTWLMAGEDFRQNPDAEKFCELVSEGHAKWLPNHHPGPKPRPVAAPDIEGPPSPTLRTMLTEVPPPKRYRATKAEMEERRRLAAQKAEPEQDLPPWETVREEMS